MFKKDKEIIIKFLLLLLFGFLIPFNGANAESDIFLNPFSIMGPDTTTLGNSNGTFTVRTDSSKSILYTEFLPDTSVDCDSIVFVQTCKISFWDGSKWVAKKPGDIVSKWWYRDDDTTADTTFVDHVFCEKDPNYNGDDPQDNGKKGSSGSSKLSFLKYSPAGTATPATMFDPPYIEDSVFPTGTTKVKMEFEVAAICEDDGKVLGSFNWEHNRNKGDAGGGVDSVTTTGTAPDTASAGLTAAKDKFVTNHTDSTGIYCPEKRMCDSLYKDIMDAICEVLGYSPGSLSAGEIVTAQYTITNMGFEELHDLTVGFTLNGLKVDETMIPMLLPGESQLVAFSFVAEEGDNVAQCLADYYGDYEEFDEHNNDAVQVIQASGSSAVPIFNRFVLTVLILGLILTAAFIIKKRVVGKT